MDVVRFPMLNPAFLIVDIPKVLTLKVARFTIKLLNITILQHLKFRDTDVFDLH
jgi:hypothetical protein